jgi:quinol monooxygenase YgiN
MILVTGSIVAREDTLDEVLELCLEHVERSRREPGCLSHAVHRDAEQPLRLVFVETWEDREALAAHFRVPACRQFAAALPALTDGPGSLSIYDATPIEAPAG